MKKIIFTLNVAFATLCCFPQEINSIDATFDDYLSLFQKVGYNMYVYDISSLKDNTTYVEFCVKEYVNGNLVDDEDLHRYTVKLIRRVSEFSEDDQKEINAMGFADNVESDIFRLATYLKIGFTPIIRDSIQEVQFEVAGKKPMALTHKRLKLRDIRVDKSHRKLNYETRPFIIDDFKKGKFIPLVLYVAPWWDENSGIYRLCGETEMRADMSSQVLKLSPHYFIIGVEFK